MDMTSTTARTIHRRRLEAALSRSELAEAVGCRIGAIQSIEDSGDLSNWPLRLVARLLEVLAIDWSDLDEWTASNEIPATDVERLGAEIVRTGRLRQVDVQAAGLGDALPVLNKHLAAVGMALSPGSKGVVTLIAADGPNPIPRQFADVSDRLTNGALTKPEREVVMSVIAGDLDVQRLSTAKTRALASLLRAGFIATRDGRHVVGGSLAHALGISSDVEAEPIANPVVA